jgi:uncharacterized repeat protein (TIGR03803 family)
VEKFSLSRVVCIVLVLCAVTAIASPGQTFTTQHNFAGYPTDGASPYVGLVQGIDGNFYGTTAYGGANDAHDCDFGNVLGCGTVFKITSGGTLTPLYSFCPAGFPCTDGANPFGLVQGTDGNFYGTTHGGGSYDVGTVFKIDPYCPLPAFVSTALDAAHHPGSRYFFWTGESKPESATGCRLVIVLQTSPSYFVRLVRSWFQLHFQRLSLPLCQGSQSLLIPHPLHFPLVANSVLTLNPSLSALRGGGSGRGRRVSELLTKS